MFTGIIEQTGTVESRTETPEGVTFAVSVSGMERRLAPGDSIAVSGVCQTVESVAGDTFRFTSVGETLRKTTLGSMQPPHEVNLEWAATPETALSGHLVQGHVDGVGRVEAFEEVSGADETGKELTDRLLTIELPTEILSYVVKKGSIAIDGVSLTVVAVKPDNRITITIIPYTLDKTIVRHYRGGTLVNVEADIIGKYVRHYMTEGYGYEQPSVGRTVEDVPER
jgi:riboflavin synthase